MTDNYKIYVHINKINGKMYIGQTKQKVEDRWLYGYGYQNNVYFWKAIQKYGWDNFDHIVLIDNLSLEEANIIETELIKKYNTIDNNIGYNLKPGGKNAKNTIETNKKISQSKLGHSVSEETRRKISDNHADYKGENNPRYGQHCTEETKQKIREKVSGSNNGNFGKQRSIKTRQKISKSRSKRVYQYTKDGIYINTFYGIREAERQTSIGRESISRCCRGKLKTAGGYVWKYED